MSIQVPGRFPRTSRWLTNSMIKQEELIYKCDLTYSRIYLDKAHIHSLATTQFYKKLIDWKIWKDSSDSLCTFLFQEGNSLEHNLDRFWEVEPVEQSSVTSEQHACEQHFNTHIQPNKMEDLFSYYQGRWIPSKLALFSCLQNENYMHLISVLKHIQNLRFSIKI